LRNRGKGKKEGAFRRREEKLRSKGLRKKILKSWKKKNREQG
jgi:hypothetical protein